MNAAAASLNSKLRFCLFIYGESCKGLKVHKKCSINNNILQSKQFISLLCARIKNFKDSSIFKMILW